MRNFLRDLPNWPGWLLLVLCGLLATFYGALGKADFSQVHLELESPARYIVLAIGVIVVLAGLVALVSGSRAEKLPIEKITIDLIKPTSIGKPKIQVSGHVTPKKKDVNVFILRQNLGDRGVAFSLAPGHGTTNDDGYWEHQVALWTPVDFKIFAVVTTQAYEDLFTFYRRVFDAMLNERKRQEYDTTHVPGWPNLGELPKTRVLDSKEYQLPQ